MQTLESVKKWVYFFNEGDGSMRNLLGGKGAGLAEMTQAGLPVPPGFTVITDASIAYYELGSGGFPLGLWEQVLNGIHQVEKENGKQFGNPENPLLVSVRSGAPVSMPGMMDTVLNLGLNQETLLGLSKGSGGKRFAYDAYRRFIQMFSKIVLGISSDLFEEIIDRRKLETGISADAEFTAEDWELIANSFREIVQEQIGKPFPEDPYEQLALSVKAVMESWNGRRAIDYRNFYKIPHTLGTAINVVAMVFGNMDENSGTGVAFTRDPATGEKVMYGEYLVNAQGEDVVAGIRTPRKISELARSNAKIYKELETIAQRLESHYRDAQDMEFTIERGTLYMLQTRSAKRTAQAAVTIAVDMVKENLITTSEALLRVEPEQIVQMLLPGFDQDAKERASKNGDLLATGLNASPGAASGMAVFDPDKAAELGDRGEHVILIRTETNPDDVHGMLKAQGVLTARGGATSHAAVVARGLGKPCVAGCEALTVAPDGLQCSLNNQVIRELEEVSIDGTTGEVFRGRLPTVEASVAQQLDLMTLLEWANKTKELGVWANADTPDDAQRALDYGAEGIGLCRTEHMFFYEERLPIVRKMILAAAEATGCENEVRRIKQELASATIEQRETLQKLLIVAEQTLEDSSQVKDYHEALNRLLDFQVQDFKDILRVMDHKPVIIRLLDPPLHEFLPKYEELMERFLSTVDNRIRRPEETAGLGNDIATALAELREQLIPVEGMRESNPMLGLRGCRLGLLYEAINEMQTRAIIGAACDLKHEGFDPRPEIMVPLVGHANELAVVRDIIERVAKQVQIEKSTEVDYKIGTMIELPRAAVTADEIAQHAEFFSFGTNDLTQTTYGFSRDDAEAKVIMQYVARGILPENPFQVLDREGVGQLINIGVERGRSSHPNLEIGICGEHGGDPSSIEFCHSIGLNYVSASPFRVPVARLSAAHAVLNQQGKEIEPTTV